MFFSSLLLQPLCIYRFLLNWNKNWHYFISNSYFGLSKCQIDIYIFIMPLNYNLSLIGKHSSLRIVSFIIIHMIHDISYIIYSSFYLSNKKGKCFGQLHQSPVWNDILDTTHHSIMNHFISSPNIFLMLCSESPC